MAREVTVTYELNEPPSFLSRAFVQRNDDGIIEIGLLKANGDIYHSSYIEWDQFWADVQFLQEAHP